ncbi:MAG: hypothetical protein IJ731_06805 [Eubacterium sp.]|nr:hypothetical protein [Eubacterium sp.]
MKELKTINSMWYHANDVAVLLGVCRTKAYDIINELRNQQASMKIPGSTNRYYQKPPRGQIQKSFFCESYSLDVKECDKVLAERRVS